MTARPDGCSHEWNEHADIHPTILMESLSKRQEKISAAHAVPVTGTRLTHACCHVGSAGTQQLLQTNDTYRLSLMLLAIQGGSRVRLIACALY